MQPIEAIQGLDSVSLTVYVLLDVSSNAILKGSYQ